MKNKKVAINTIFVEIALAFLLISCTQENKKITARNLYEEFQNPPNVALPRVWWHWMNGNISKDGIRKDLHWMKQAGIGGFQNFDAGLFTPQVVQKRLTFMTPEWKDAFGFATTLADSLGLEMAIAGSPGWSQSGGPWVPAKDGMKKLVWREIRVKGGVPFDGTLPKPYDVTGNFQNIPKEVDNTTFLDKASHIPTFYDDMTPIRNNEHLKITKTITP